MKRTKSSGKMNMHGAILTNDPSMTAWGYVVLNWNGEILKVGCIKTIPNNEKLRIRKGDSTVRRISEINQVLLSVIKDHGVSYILSELPHGSQNASSAVMIGVVAAIIQTISDVLNIGVEWYSENDAKKCLFNRRSVTKQEMVDKIGLIYKVPWTGVDYKDKAIADALSIHYVALKQSSTLKLLKIKNSR